MTSALALAASAPEAQVARIGVVRRSARKLRAALERLFDASTCTRCGGAMLDHLPRPDGKICILCVADETARQPRPLASPELAGCAAVLRALLAELEAAARTGGTPNVEQVRQLTATASAIAWWVTPPNLRVPTAVAIDAGAVSAVLNAHDQRWGVKPGATSLVGTFEHWRRMQLRALQYAELTDIDRRYAALTGKESLVRDCLPETTRKLAGASWEENDEEPKHTRSRNATQGDRARHATGAR